VTARASERSAGARVPDTQREWIGLIAGNGRFPLLFAENARRLGYRVSAVALTGETDPSLERVVDRIHWVALGQLGRLIKAFKQDGVRQAVMVGGVKKTHLFSNVRPDLRSLALLRRVTVRKDDALLRAIAAELEDEGIRIRESTFGLDGLLVEEGTLTKRAPTRKEWRDIEFGWEIAEAVGRLDIGQCVVVKDRVVVAVEAVEGSDEAIRRGGKLARAGSVVVKRFKPQQDRRFDLPAIGPGTIRAMAESGAADREDAINAADQAGIAIVGLAR
jgi:UDP-2,3-diacylglucosamine hydrolase